MPFGEHMDFYCRGCSHYTNCVDGETCEWCGSTQTGLATQNMSGTKGFRTGTGRQMKEDPDVYQQINYGYGYRLAMGFGFLHRVGDRGRWDD